MNKTENKTLIKDSGSRTTFDSGAERDVQSDKGRMDLLPKMTIWALARHYEEGAKKYADRNWEKGMPVSRLLDSAQRHLTKFELGMTDENHLIAAIWNVIGMYETLLRIELGVLPKELNDLPYTFKGINISDDFDPWEMHTKFVNTGEKE